MTFTPIPTGKLHSCKNCGHLHYAGCWDTRWSTGEFCTRKCTRSFSTKARRAEISAKVSATLRRKIKVGTLS